MCRSGTRTNGLNTLSMNAEWTTSPNARRVLQHAQDTRPAWLWSQDGQRLIWSNPAAGLFLAKLKKSGLKLAPLAVPLKGQVARTIRLGSPGRTSLARIQFNAGDKPASTTCATTPLLLEGEEAYLLIVSVDPIDPEILAASGAPQENAIDAVTPPEAAAPEIVADEPTPQHNDDAPEMDHAIEPPSTPAPEAVEVSEAPFETESEPEDELAGAPQAVIAPDDSYSRELHDWQDADPETVYTPAAEPTVFTDEVNASDLDEEDEPASEDSPERPLFRSLSALVDRLAADEDLFTPLNEADDEVPQSSVPEEPVQRDEAAPRLFKITGRGLRTNIVPAPEVIVERAEDDALFPAGTEPEIAHDLVERVSRYNFDELSRILNDRVGLQGAGQPVPPTADAGPVGAAGSLVSLGGETLVLNRLPLGILVFRDQQILFANRAITEMVGYESVESLRQAGLTAIFPASNGEQDAGPVNHLVQRDGTLVPVTARLQSTSWQGRPALMLSASTTEVRTGHEDAVRAFAQAFAELRGDGFVELSRTGVVRLSDSSASAALGAGNTILGKPLSALISSEDGFALRGFLQASGPFCRNRAPRRYPALARQQVRDRSVRSGPGRYRQRLFRHGAAAQYRAAACARGAGCGPRPPRPHRPGRAAAAQHYYWLCRTAAQQGLWRARRRTL
ncbi:hypothetical protein [Devosia riboflavina]